MSDIFQIANIGLLDGKQRLQALSSNAASASLTGYRAKVPTQQVPDTDFSDVLGRAVPDTDLLDVSARAGYQVDLRRGGPIATGRALDLSIEADDLFFALTDGTQTWLTRAGAFRVADDGVLVGEGGRPVVGAQGEIRLPSSDVLVTPQGQVMQQGVVVAALQLYRTNDRHSLQAAEGSLLLSPAGMTAVDPAEVRVRSGELEASNTDATREMLALMSVSRQFESLSRVLQSYDELLGRAIQKLSEG